MRNRWFKMLSNIGSNPVLQMTAQRLQEPPALIISTLALACELHQDAPETDFAAEETHELLGFMLQNDHLAIGRILAEVTRRGVFPPDFSAAPKSAAERKRDQRQREKQAVVTSHAENVTCHETNVTGHSRERERIEEKRVDKRDTPIPPQEGAASADFGFEAFWAARPGRGKATESRKAAEREYQKLVQDGMSPDDLLQAMQRYTLACQSMEPRIDGTRHALAPANFLKEAHFDKYLHQEAVPVVVDTGEDLPEWQQPLCQLIEPYKVRSWFKGTEKRGFTIYFPKKFSRDHVRNNFAQDIERVFGHAFAYEVRA